ncbi:MAG: lipopolysaccharide biosynthesis protein [Desulfuromonadaceae bacterium]|nr:lipopolysaccharide biosynthesis protein [Desulfuromonadaceae bacterium]
MNDSLRSKTLKNIGYNTISKFFSMAVQAVANIILTRILLPADYGILGLAYVFIAFINQFNDFGISGAVTRRLTLSDDQLYTGFTMKFLLGLALFLITFVGAPIAGLFFDNPVIVNVVRVSSLQFLINFFQFIPSVLLTRELNFKAISSINMISSIATSLIAITLAYSGFSFWSLVIANLFTMVCSVTLMNIIKPIKIRFCLDSSVAMEYFRFGGNLFLTGLVAFAILNVNSFVVGAVNGATSLGYYNLAASWGSMVFTVILGVVMSVLNPTFARFQDNLPKMKNVFLQGLGYVTVVSAMLNITLFVTASEFLCFVLGKGTDKWLPAVSSFQILCIYGIFRIMIYMVAPVFLAVGNSRIFLVSDLLVAIVQLSLVYPVLKYFGIEGLALLLLGVTFIQLPIYIPGLRRVVDVQWRELLSVVWPSFIASIVVVFVFFTWENIFEYSLAGFFKKGIAAALLFIIVHSLATKGRYIIEFRGILGEVGFIAKQ